MTGRRRFIAMQRLKAKNTMRCGAVWMAELQGVEADTPYSSCTTISPSISPATHESLAHAYHSTIGVQSLPRREMALGIGGPTVGDVFPTTAGEADAVFMAVAVLVGLQEA